MRAAALAMLVIAAGCATARTRPVGARVTLGYTDHRLFAVTHYGAAEHERNASDGLRGYGGRIAGRACGVDVNYEVQYRGRNIEITGFVKKLDVSATKVFEKPAELDVRDRAGRLGIERSIVGNIGGSDAAETSGGVRGNAGFRMAAAAAVAPHHEVELELGYERLTGHVGFRDFDLHADGDAYVGTMRFAGHPLPFRLRGRGAMWSMPAADQATILPFVITCIADDRHLVQEVDMGYAQ